MDESELRAQLEQHHAASYGWALSCCSHNAAEAEDVLHTAYVNVLDGRARYGGRAAFRTWLFAVIRRTAAEARRRDWMRKLGLIKYQRAKPLADDPGHPSHELEHRETGSAIRQALDNLPRRQREALHLVFYQDLTVEEAAGVMGVSVGSARQHYERGKSRLREWLGRMEESNDYQ